jgi:rod shape-determining protein MreC
VFSLLKRYREPLLVGALIIVPLISFLSRGGQGREPNFIDRRVLGLAKPVQSALTGVFGIISSTVSGYVALRGAHQAANECRVGLVQAQAELNTLTEVRAENQRLKEVLHFVEASSGSSIIARVIGLNASQQFQSFLIDRGESDGVHVGMPVVTPTGVVGQIVRVVAGSADVMVMLDPRSRIGALVQRTRVRGTVVGAGDGQKMLLDFVHREDDIKEGDVVVTAGTDGVYPRGLAIGTIKSVSMPPGALFLLGQVEPAVDLGRVEEVLVLPLIEPSALRAPVPR